MSLLPLLPTTRPIVASDTGALRWRSHVGNLVAASPALDTPGNVFIGTFGGDVVSLEGDTGKSAWRTHLDGHVYASVAVAPGQLAMRPPTVAASWRKFSTQ